MSYENAPATKLLATACACCGRALVDAVSVETGIGPDCREKYGVTFDTTNDAHVEANALVFQVARKGMTAESARPIFDRLAALGFSVLADRIAKRFRTEVTRVDVEALRAEYAKKLNAFAYDNASKQEINDAVRAFLAYQGIATPGPVDFVDAIEHATCPCRRCASTGRYVRGTENGAPMYGEGDCFRCQGKGSQDLADAYRNRAYDAHRMSRAA